MWRRKICLPRNVSLSWVTGCTRQMLLMVGEREVFPLFVPEIEQRTPTILEALLSTCGISDSMNNFSIEPNLTQVERKHRKVSMEPIISTIIEGLKLIFF